MPPASKGTACHQTCSQEQHHQLRRASEADHQLRSSNLASQFSWQCSFCSNTPGQLPGQVNTKQQQQQQPSSRKASVVEKAAGWTGFRMGTGWSSTSQIYLVLSRQCLAEKGSAAEPSVCRRDRHQTTHRTPLPVARHHMPASGATTPHSILCSCNHDDNGCSPPPPVHHHQQWER